MVEGCVASKLDAKSCAPNHSAIVVGSLLATIALQAAGFLWFGVNSRGWLCSQLAQTFANVIAVACMLQAFRRSKGLARYFWFLFSISISLWVIANGVFIINTLSATNYGVDPGVTTLLDFLYRGYGVPLLLVLFVDERDEYTDSLTLLDSAQAGVVVVSVYLWLLVPTLRGPIRNALTANVFLFSNVENLLLTGAAALRWRLAQSTLGRRLFRQLCLFLLVYSGISGFCNYSSEHSGNLLTAWMDLFWTIPYCMAAIMAVRWTMPAAAELPKENLPAMSLGKLLPRNLAWSFALLCVVFSLVFAVARWQHITGMLAAGVSLFLYALRLSLTQQRQAKTIKHLTHARRKWLEITQRNALILQSTGEGIVGLDSKGQHTFVNAAAAGMFGYRPDELIGRQAHSTWHHTRADGHPFSMEECPIHLTLRNGEVHREQFAVFWRRDGSCFYVDYVSSPIRKGKQVIGAVVTFRDVTNKRHADEVLRLQSEALNSAANTIIITDSLGNILWANPAFEVLTGYSLSEVVGQNPRFLKSGKQGADFYRSLWETIRTGNIWHGELENRRRDGSVYMEEMTITPLRSAAGTITHFIAIKQDVTSRKHTEEELRRSEERFRFAFEQGPLGIIAVGTDHRLLKVNQAFCRMLGYGEDELLMRPLTDITLPEDRDRDRLLSDRILDGKTSDYKWQKHYVKKSGEPVTVEIAASLIRDEKDRPLYALGLINDITERQKAEEALRESEQRYRLAVTAAHEAIWDVDLANGTVNWNETFFEMFGNPHANADPWRWWVDRVHPEDRQRVMQTFQAVLQGSKTSWVCEYRCLRSNGEWADIFDRAYIGRDDSGSALRVTRAMNDVTEKRLLEAQLRRAQKLDAVGRLAGGVAHDFNNLLGIILGYSDVIQTQLSPQDPARKGLDEIKKAGSRAANLTRKLLTFSRQQATVPQVLDLNSLIADFREMLSRLIGEDVKIVFVAGEKLGRIKADPGLLEQVIMNLAVNARDAMPDGGTLSIKTVNAEVDENCATEYAAMEKGPYVLLSVADTGCGIDSQVLPHIFDPFFTTKEPDKGTGLGLSIVYGAIRQCGGYIWVKSQPNQGTIFEIFLPVTAEGLTAAEVTAPSVSVRGSETILVVEDEPALNDLIQIVLTKAGYKLLVACAGDEALALLGSAKETVDLLITDLVMPGGWGGQQLAAAACQIRPHIRTLFMTGYAGEKQIEPVLNSGNVLITKPFDAGLLLRKVRDILDRDVRAKATSSSSH